jgi:hypothetical protein
MPKSCRRSATSSVTSKSGPNKRVGARDVCDLPCLPGRGAYASLNARWPSPPGILVLGLCSGSFTFIGRAGPDRAGARPYHSATPDHAGAFPSAAPDCASVHSCRRQKLKTPNSKLKKQNAKLFSGVFVSFVKPIRFEDFTYAFGRRSSVRHR